jgi:hypothetical protein
LSPPLQEGFFFINLLDLYGKINSNKGASNVTYQASAPRSVFIWLIFLILLTSFFGYKFQFGIAIVTLAASLLQFHLQIDTNRLEYKLSLYKVTVYRKKLAPDQIAKIKFVRIGWTTKDAIIKPKQGLSFRVSHFYNETIIHRLEQFASENNVEVIKTRDYHLLERYYTQK